MNRNIRGHRLIPILLALPVAWLGACASQSESKYRMAKPNITVDLDSLHRAALREDSAASGIFFYEQAYEEYRGRYPGVDRPAYMRVAKGKDRDFCLFRKDPAAACLEVGTKMEALGLVEPAIHAYEASLLSEGMNDGKMNVQLWSSLGRIHIERKEFAQAKSYLGRVLEVEPGNRQAKKMLAAASRPKSKG